MENGTEEKNEEKNKEKNHSNITDTPLNSPFLHAREPSPTHLPPQLIFP